MKKLKHFWLGLTMIFTIIIFVTGCSNKETPEEIFNAYLSNWQEMNFAAMYQSLSKEAKAEISQKEFVERYENIYEGMEMNKLQVDTKVDSNNTKKQQDKSSVSYDYKVKMETFVGPIEFTHQATLIKEKGDSEQEWFVDWNPSLIFPSLEDGDKVGVQTLKASRGEIRDRNGSGVAINDHADVIGIVPSKLGDEPKTSKAKIAKLLGISIDEIEHKLEAEWVEPDVFVPLVTLPMGETNLDAFLEIPGVKIQEKTVRTYPFGESAAHITGYVREITADQLSELEQEGYASGDVVGNSGLEKVFEDRLRGKDGGHIYIKRSDGSFKETLAKEEAIPGEDIELTIDAALQFEIFEQLKEDAGAAVALDPKTGAILSLVSTPSFDPNTFVRGLSDKQWKQWSEDPNKPFLNRFTNRYSPGSVFKTTTAAVGLKTGVTSQEEVRKIVGKHWKKDDSWGDYYVTRVHDKKLVTLRDAIVYSDNIYFAQEALEMGIDSFSNEVYKFGFDEKLPIPFPIAPSTLSNNGIDREVQLADSAYGQGEIMMSPLHLALTYTPYLNQGDLLYPHLLESEERTVWKKSLIEAGIAELIKESLIQVVEDPDGTGYRARIPGMTIGGKSGTAEIKASKGDESGSENGWFIGFTTEEDSPLLLTMMVEDVKGRGGSGYVIPKVKHIFETIQND
ncbi:penicillin-binding transpeptidase domain-containing protein [Oceanobacillus profundus]|uniref:penicillin-binding transpeptidase domain-containing protein n=1 Tax=Oceanobacillus profundus TaxID=372463 RepID=UPI00203ECDBC|nr:penicillin-binding transpeptidase domain-containing protein [Oceanobacillus profundus]MCM3396690.1 penicillin-binding transpeptidase domain-containing protein [Oceanobacillus profundus]